MKKLLLLFCACTLFSVTSSAQSLSLSWSGGAISNGDLITVSGDTTGIVYAYVFCRNNDDSTVSVKVKKKYINIVTGSLNAFCWGNCYPPAVFVSGDIVDIQKDSTSNGFSGEYQALGHIGTSIVMYTFYNVETPSDSVSVQVAYDCSLGLSAPGHQNSDIRFSGAFPNPANHQTSFTFNFPSSRQDAKLVIRDMIGNIVSQKVISDLSGTITIETDNLGDGVYFYSLMLNEQPYITRKLVIRR